MNSTDLPQDVVSILPADPSAQLELASKIVAFAFSTKVSELEFEARQMRETLIQKQGTIKNLERRVGNLESEVQELHAKNRSAAEEAHKLQNEKSALIDTVKKLNRDVAKLEAFKKNLLQHLHDDDEPVKLEPSLAAVDMSSERLVSEVLQSASKGLGGAGSHMTSTYATRGSRASADATMSGLPPTRTPYAPTASSSHPNSSGGPGSGGGFLEPRTDSFGGSLTFSAGIPNSGGDRGVGVDGSTSGNGSPPLASSSFFAPPSNQAIPSDLTPDRGPSSGSSGQLAPTDGKEFFRQARDRLSYEQFTKFLHNIKELNAGRQSRDDTLWEARNIFGPSNQDLYALLEGLLSRQANP